MVNEMLVVPLRSIEGRSRKFLNYLLSFFMAVGLLLPPAAGLAAPAPQPAQTGLTISTRSLELNEQGIQALQKNDFKNAELLFRRALEADSGNLTAAFNLAGILLNDKRIPETIDLLKTYLTVASEDAGLHARLGDAYFANKQLQEALSSYQQARRLDGEYPKLATKLATIHGLLNQPEEAERMLIAAVEQDPKDGQSLASLSAIYLANGKPDKAVGAAKRALQVKPTSEVYVTLGAAYEAGKDYKNSLIAFQRAADLGDGRQEIKDKIEDLKKRLS